MFACVVEFGKLIHSNRAWYAMLACHLLCSSEGSVTCLNGVQPVYKVTGKYLFFPEVLWLTFSFE